MHNKVKLAIVGSRTFNDYKKAEEIINSIRDKYNYEFILMVSGGARGADLIGEQYADKYDIPKKIFYAEWKKHGRRAGFIRNVDIIETCDICICFWDGESHGTKHDIELCNEKHKVCYVYNFITDERKVFEN